MRSAGRAACGREGEGPRLPRGWAGRQGIPGGGRRGGRGLLRAGGGGGVPWRRLRRELGGGRAGVTPGGAEAQADGRGRQSNPGIGVGWESRSGLLAAPGLPAGAGHGTASRPAACGSAPPGRYWD